MLQDWMIPGDLAPGDAKSLQRNWAGLQARCIESPDDSGFDAAFGALWAEFGANAEIEQPTVIARRLTWNGDKLSGGWSLRYRLMLFRMHGKFAAVRDHTAIVGTGARRHNVHAFSWSRRANGGAPDWQERLRGSPITTAREYLAAQSCRSNANYVVGDEISGSQCPVDLGALPTKARATHGGSAKDCLFAVLILSV
jgi:hypothetical protein